MAEFQKVQPLDSAVPIVNENRTPSAQFMRLWQQSFLNAQVTQVTVETVETGLDAKADKTITISAGTGLSGGGDLSANRTIDLEDTAVTPGTYGDATNVAQITVDQQGRITAASNVAVSGGGGGGDYVLISTSSPSATGAVTFSSIPGTYKDLIVVLTGRSAAAVSASIVQLTLNGDTAANYDYRRENRFGAAANSAANYVDVGEINGAATTASYPSPMTIELQDYAGTTFYKSVTATSNITGFIKQDTQAVWKSTAAVTSLTLTLASAANYDTGTIVSLYGRG